MTVSTLISSNTPNKNDRVYTRDVLEKIVKEIETGNTIYGTIGYNEITQWSHIVELKQVSHEFSKPVITDNVLYVDITILDTPQGKVLQNLLKHSEIVFRPYGYTPLSGIIKEITANNYTFISFNAVPKSTDAFEGLL